MRIEFDPEKDKINQDKHELSLALASELDWRNSLDWIDTRKNYGEVRLISLAPSTGILYYVAYVDRNESRRIISLRKANRREVKHYVSNI